MITIYPSESRYQANHGWLRSNFSFSFAEYYDPNNLHFGPMRVLNDDVVQPNRGFGAHPHQEMEIVSIVLKGQLMHEDSTGHSATTTFGGVQRMTAGTGVMHSEMNPSSTEEVQFLQLWFLPESRGLTPSYEKTTFDIEKLKNRLLPVVSKAQASEQVADIHQDLTIYLSDLEAGQSLEFRTNADRRIFVFVIEGELNLKGDSEATLHKRDSARITALAELQLHAASDTRFMLIDLP